MYNFIRAIISIIITCGIASFARKSSLGKKKWINGICILLGVLLYIIFGFIPLENIVSPFNSPIKVFEYRNPGAKPQLIIEGRDSDYIIGSEGDDFTTVTMIVPKTDDGWKMGTGTELKTIYRGFDKNVIFNLYQYKNTNDFYMMIYDLDGVEIEIKDACNSTFYELQEGSAETLSSLTYYAFIPNYDENYWISVNGEQIELKQQ